VKEEFKKKDYSFYLEEVIQFLRKGEFKEKQVCPMHEAHACNLSYLGSRDQDACGSKPASSSGNSISKKTKTFTIRGWW
jgi:hypothetical protein